MDRAATRCLLLTPPGAGAIGVVRVIGPGAVSLAEQIFVPGRQTDRSRAETRGLVDDDGTPSWAEAPAGRVRYGRVIDDGVELDDALVSGLTLRSEPAFDICVHGGVRVVERLLGLLERRGAVIAGSYDLDEEVWASKDLIDHEAIEAVGSAKTMRAVRLIAWQRRYLREALIDLSARPIQNAEGARLQWDAILSTYEAARLILRGATVALVGPPNSGKSTLFNRLVGRKAALASPIAGTTRDWVTAEVEIRGVPVTLVDTAGVHETADGSEREAISSGRSLARSTKLIVLVLDGARAPTDNDAALVGWARTQSRVVVALNKADCRRPLGEDSVKAWGLRADVPVVWVSAAKQTGLTELTARILSALGLVRDDIDCRPALFTERLLEAGRGVTAGLNDDPSSFARSLRRNFLGPCGRSRRSSCL